jgi:mannose-6-phosphate isomerase-like protein (cupin superfamily)
LPAAGKQRQLCRVVQIVLELNNPMKIISSNNRTFIPAGHENPLAPGLLKKVLFQKDDLRPGRVQMVNWAKLLAGKSFAAHYHEDLQEIFIVIQGTAEIS